MSEPKRISFRGSGPPSIPSVGEDRPSTRSSAGDSRPPPEPSFGAKTDAAAARPPVPLATVLVVDPDGESRRFVELALAPAIAHTDPPNVVGTAQDCTD